MMTTYWMRLLICLSCLIANTAWAGRPFYTDDAALATAQTCQIESWMQVNANNDHDLWALPACNPSGNFEMTAGLNQLRTHSNSNKDSYFLQGKTLFRELQTNSWGVGMAAGINHAIHGNKGSEFIYVPYSLSFLDDQLLVHANVGWIKTPAPIQAQTSAPNQAKRSNRTTWGLGSEYTLLAGLSVFAEAFGDDVVRPSIHGGLNISIVPNKLNLNITGGRDYATDTQHNFYAIGLNFYGLR